MTDKNGGAVIWADERGKHLDPLLNMRLGELLNAISKMDLYKAEKVFLAMDSCTQTNCGWTEYQLAKRFRTDVIKRILMLKARQQ